MTGRRLPHKESDDWKAKWKDTPWETTTEMDWHDEERLDSYKYVTTFNINVATNRSQCKRIIGAAKDLNGPF